MIWVYGICERPEHPPRLGRGLAEEPLDYVREGDLLAVVTRHADAPGEPVAEALWLHENVVERIMADRPVLPMRFRSTVPDDDALRAFLADRHDAFVEALDRLRGRVELGVRAVQHRPAAVPAPTGRAYMDAKLRDSREVAAVHEPLAAAAVDVARLPARSPEEALRASYLVEATEVDRFRGVVERLQQAYPGVAILCTGPWPPYSFVPDTTPPVAGAVS